MVSFFEEQEGRMQDVHMTSVFRTKEQLDRKRFQKMMSSSHVGRSGRSASPCPVIAEEHGTMEVVFKRTVEKSFAEEKLQGLQQAWSRWRSRTTADVPLDNRELANVRRQAVEMARRQLGEALRGGDSAAIGEAIRNADDVADVFPCAPEVKSALEYKAAIRHGEHDDL